MYSKLKQMRIEFSLCGHLTVNDYVGDATNQAIPNPPPAQNQYFQVSIKVDVGYQHKSVLILQQSGNKRQLNEMC